LNTGIDFNSFKNKRENSARKNKKVIRENSSKKVNTKKNEKKDINSGMNQKDKPFGNTMDFSEFLQKQKNKNRNPPLSSNVKNNNRINQMGEKPKIMKKEKEEKNDNVLDFKSFKERGKFNQK